MADRGPDDAHASACHVCRGPLAADQRYCLTCGARRGALPAGVAGMLAAMREQGARPAPPPSDPSRAGTATAPPARSGPFPRLPGPQALAATLLAALGFGVLAGSLAPAPLGNLVSAPLSILVHLPPRSASSAPSAASQDASAASAAPAQTQQTITETTPAPATPAPTQQTTTVPASTTPATTNPGGGNQGSGGLLGLPPIKHVFLIVLADQGFTQTFDPGIGDPYLSKTLPRQGELVEDYYGVTGSSLANAVALISGQGPTQQTAANCPQYTPIQHPKSGSEGQVVGTGCVYPKSTPTLASELVKKGLTWRAYVDGMNTDPHAKPSTCRHAALGANDANYAPSPTDPYVTWRNPFMYFAGVTAKPACAKSDVGINELAKDLSKVKTTAAFSYIVPSPCEDGDSTPCSTGAPAGLAPADTWLKNVIAEIKRSPAYKADGLIAVTFDHAPQGGPYADSNACCATPPYPNMPASAQTTPTGTSTTPTGTTTTPTGTTTTPTDTTSTPTGTTTTPTGTTPTPTGTTSTPTGTTTTPTDTTTTPTTTPTGMTGPNPGDVSGQTTPTGGGGQVGLMLLSQYVKAGSVESIDYYNHFSLLATIENLFGVKRLGFASDRSLTLFDTQVFNAG